LIEAKPKQIEEVKKKEEPKEVVVAVSETR
jgi:hypothetical protein